MSSRRLVVCLAVLAFVGCKRKPDATALAKDDGKGITHGCKLVAGGRIAKDTRIQADCQVTVDETYSIVGGATLSIDAGARLEFKKGARLIVEDGSLVAIGVKTRPVVITSAEPKPAPGDWGGIALFSSKPSKLEEVVVEYAGDEPKPPAATTKTAPPPASGALGLLRAAHAGSRTPIPDRRPGLYVGPEAKVSLVGVTVRHSKKVGIAVDGDAPFVAFETVTLEDDGGYAMDVNAGVLGGVGSIVATEPVRVRGSVNTTQSWPKLDLVVASLEVVAREPGGAVVLTLAPESIVRVEPKASLRFGGYAEGGAIVAKKVLFTSAAPNPAPGDWAGIHFDKRAPGTLLDGCIVEYAGYEDPLPPSTTRPAGKPRPKPAALVLLEPMKDFQITHVTFRHNAGPGMGEDDPFGGLLAGTGGCEGLDAKKYGNESIGQPLCEYHEDELAKTFGALGLGDGGRTGALVDALGTRGGIGSLDDAAISGPGGGRLGGLGGGGTGTRATGGGAGIGYGGGAGELRTKSSP